MKLVLIFGPQAVGKMTVGEELAKLTGLKLFHNHMSIELVANFFSYGSPSGKRLVGLFRKEIFEEVAKSDLYGLIFTYVWAFDIKEDWDYVDSICKLFSDHGSDIYLVELEADIQERLRRNKTPHRLEAKPTKRNIEWSEKDIVTTAKQYRLNSYEGEIKTSNYIKINNTNLDANEVAEIIKNKFNL